MSATSMFSRNAITAYYCNLRVSSAITYTGMLGYRILSVDYEWGSGRTKYEYDVGQHGPAIGLSVKFRDRWTVGKWMPLSIAGHLAPSDWSCCSPMVAAPHRRRLSAAYGSV